MNKSVQMKKINQNSRTKNAKHLDLNNRGRTSSVARCKPYGKVDAVRDRGMGFSRNPGNWYNLQKESCPKQRRDAETTGFLAPEAQLSFPV